MGKLMAQNPSLIQYVYVYDGICTNFMRPPRAICRINQILLSKDNLIIMMTTAFFVEFKAHPKKHAHESRTFVFSVFGNWLILLAHDIFNCIIFNENCCILIKMLLKYIRKGPIDNIPAIVQIMARRQTGDKPLSEPMISLVWWVISPATR